MNIYENIEKEIDTLYSRLIILNKEDFEEEKNKIAQEYGLSNTELEQLIEQTEHYSYLYARTSHDDYNGDMYYDDSELYAEQKDLRITMKKEIEKYIVRQRIDEIKTDEITPELVEKLQKSGYDGKTGHPVLQSFFKMYFNIKENESKNSINKQKIPALETEIEENTSTLEALKTRDKMLKDYINSQSQYIGNVKHRMSYIKLKSEELKPHLKPKSFGEKIIRFFSRSKKKEIKETQNCCNEIEKENFSAMDDCIQAQKSNAPMSLDSILKNTTRVKNNIYDKIVSPIESNQDLADLINIYATLKDNNTLDKMYGYLVGEQKKILPEEKAMYDDNFFSFIVEPATIDMSEKISQGKYNRFDNTFRHLYTIDEMGQMFKEKNAQEIIARGRNIEGKNPEVFDKLNSIFWRNGDEDRRSLYIEYLQKNNINLNKNELLDWMDYRAVMEEFQNPKLMGFHIR